MIQNKSPIGERIRFYRKAKKLTQIELADKAGIAVNSLRLYEAGKRNPSIETLFQIADALNVSFESLLSYPDIERLYREFNDPCEIVYNQFDMPAFVMIGDTPGEQEFYALVKMESLQYWLLDSFAKLNADGQQKAIERVKELTEIARFTSQDKHEEQTDD